VAAIKERHKPIEDCFERGLGFQLMLTESNVLVDGLLALAQSGITALPLHDSVLVASSQAESALAIMEAVYVRHTAEPRAHIKIDFGI
jgi:hypothetical protein